MNKRFFLALVLTAIVIVVTPLLFPSAMRRSAIGLTDSTAAKLSTSTPSTRETASGIVPAVTPSVERANSVQTTLKAPIVGVPDSAIVRTLKSAFTFSNHGAAPTAVVLDSFPSLRRNTARVAANLVAPRHSLTRYWLALDRDTVLLDTVVFRQEPAYVPGTQGISYVADVSGHSVRLSYDFASDKADEYLTRVSAAVSNAPAGSTLLLELPQTLRSNEADTLDDLNHLAVSYRPTRGEVTSISFSKLDSVEVRAEPGPINWVATRNKYFLVVYRATKTPFSQLRLQGAPRQGKVAPIMLARTALPLAADGTAAFELYAGPQNFERLQHLGGDLDQVNPYAGWLHGAVQPFATMVMRALLWMKRTTQLNYGWVLVLFGIMVRLVLWPLNQGAMRTSMKMQRLQPELQALQKKYKDDPKKQQEAIMKVYKDHGMSPLSPIMGCLPMLLPMPVLFALYYVFQNTIEFRGVPFLWLPDISLADPYYITPLLMGVSMFVMSWIGMRNAPPNPQAKMMTIMMPVMLTVLFLNFASGLNLYYAIQNIAAIPQQWLLARERSKSTAAAALEPAFRARS